MSTDDMTPEQREAVLKAFATISQSMADVITKVAEAIKPIMEAYNALPQDVKMRIAELQVKESIEDIAKPLTQPDRDQWILNRLEKDYKQYWDEKQQLYVITESGKGEEVEVWKPTRDELVADLDRSYDFEFSNPPRKS